MVFAEIRSLALRRFGVSLSVVLLSYIYLLILSPGELSIVFICASVGQVLRVLCRMGANGRLMTKRCSPTDKEYSVAFSLMLVATFFVLCVSVPFLYGVSFVFGAGSLFWPGVMSLLLLPIHVFSLPASSQLERGLNVGIVSSVEARSQMIGSSVAVILVILGVGARGVIIGWIVRDFFYLVGIYRYSPRFPRFCWSWPYARRLIWFGCGYTTAIALNQCRMLVLLLMTNLLFGQEVAGYVGLSHKMLGFFSPIGSSVSRVMLPVFVLLSEGDGSRKFLENLSAKELLAAIPVAIGSVLVLDIAVNFLDPKWKVLMHYYPWVAAGSIIASAYGLGMTALHAKGDFSGSAWISVVVIVATVVAVMISRLFGDDYAALASVLIWPGFFYQGYRVSKVFKNYFDIYIVIWIVAGILGCLHPFYGYHLLLISMAILVSTAPGIITALKCDVESLLPSRCFVKYQVGRGRSSGRA
mgnify:CR=1 FL=1